MACSKSVDYTEELVLRDRIRALEHCLKEVLKVLPILNGYGLAGKEKQNFISNLKYILGEHDSLDIGHKS